MFKQLLGFSSKYSAKLFVLNCYYLAVNVFSHFR